MLVLPVWSLQKWVRIWSLEARIISRRLTCCCRDDCRFPHVLADSHAMGRGGRFRSPPQNPINGNNQANLEEKLASLSITEVSHPRAFSRDTHLCRFACVCRTAITRHAREAVVVRRLPSVARAVRMVRTFVPPSQHPPCKSSACPMQMNSLSLVARPPHPKSTGTTPIRGRQLRRCCRLLPCARKRQSRTLRPLKGRNSFGQLQVR